jgi:hypothetical protein
MAWQLRLVHAVPPGLSDLLSATWDSLDEDHRGIVTQLRAAMDKVGDVNTDAPIEALLNTLGLATQVGDTFQLTNVTSKVESKSATFQLKFNTHM